MIWSSEGFNVNIATFDIAMWHPFGPHGLESADQILERKKKEISANGWTLWSFQYRRPEVLAAWSAELTRSTRPAVFCSSSKNAVDPAATGFATTSDACKSFRFINETQWRPFPSPIRSPHPFRKKNMPRRSLFRKFVFQKTIPNFQPSRGFQKRNGDRIDFQPVASI